jgi:hypothetical protein
VEATRIAKGIQERLQVTNQRVRRQRVREDRVGRLASGRREELAGKAAGAFALNGEVAEDVGELGSK